MSGAPDFAIIGAGIVGAACAEALTRENLRGVILESGIAGGGATAAGMGHIVVMDDSRPQFELTRYSLELWSQFRDSLPPQVEYDSRGTLWVAADEDEMTAASNKRELYERFDVRAEELDSKALSEAEPNLRKGLAGALLVPGDAVIYAPCAAQWLVDEAMRRGASLRLGVRVTELLPDGVRLSGGERISAGLTICATGTAAVELFPDLRVRARKGHLAITDRYPGFIRHQLVELGYLKSAHGRSTESVAFNVQPRAAGQVLIGSSRQYDRTDAAVERSILGRMIRRAIEFMPALSRLCVIRAWSGFRASTEDNLPAIGPCPDRRNVYIATGHEGLGITTSLATARLIADRIFNRTQAIDPEPYLPARLMTGFEHA